MKARQHRGLLEGGHYRNVQVSQLRGGEPEQVRIGMPVQVVLQPVAEYLIPLFAPIEGDAE